MNGLVLLNLGLAVLNLVLFIKEENTGSLVVVFFNLGVAALCWK